jgi:hypothetical protein
VELRRSSKKPTGVVAATILGIVLVAGCGQSDDPGPKAAVRGETTVRESPGSPSSDDEATRQMLNEMRRRIAEVKDGTAGSR